MSTRHPSRSRHRSAAKLAWPRFWARQFDNAICWALGTGVVSLLGMAFPVRGRSLLVALAIGPILVGVLHLIYEVTLLTLLGTTIGKSVFGLSVESQHGKRVEFARVLSRSVGVWLRGSYAYVLFPLATLHAWIKARDALRFQGMASWDAQAETMVIGVKLPMWHLSAGAALAIAAFGMILMWQTVARDDKAASARADGAARSSTASPIPSTPSVGSVSTVPDGSANARPALIGAVQNGKAVFADGGKSFAIKTPAARPSADKSTQELFLWAQRTYPYFVPDSQERRAMYAWMIVGTRVGMSQSAGIALGIDTVVSGRESGRGVCWPVERPSDPKPKDVASGAQNVVFGIRCER